MRVITPLLDNMLVRQKSHSLVTSTIQNQKVLHQPCAGPAKGRGASCHQKNGSVVTKKTVAVTKMELVVTNTKNGVF